MSNQRKMVPAALLDRVLLSIMEQGIEVDGQYELIEIQKTPAPPAGDLEVLGYKFNFARWLSTEGPKGWRLEFDTEKPAQFLFDDGRVKDYVELVDRAHVTRLEERCGRLDYDYVTMQADLREMTAERDALLAEVDRWKALAANQADRTEVALEMIKECKSDLTKARVWERFAGYLLDNCEGELICEESLQHWVSEMLRKEANPIAHSVDESCGQDAEAAKGGV